MTPGKEERSLPQRWKWEVFADRRSQMTTDDKGEWCKAEDVAAALEQAYRQGIEAVLDMATLLAQGGWQVNIHALKTACEELRFERTGEVKNE